MPVLDWSGKKEILNHHKEVPFRLLEKINSSGMKNSKNMLIEGDNLEALKSLFPYYKEKIKCVYIDPPYNTGNEGWKYNDNVNSPKMKKWLRKAVGKDDLSRHDKWLCMMYPRLKLLKELLNNIGIIFISIDDNEQANLKMILDEIFGSENFLAKMIWQPESVTDNQLEIKIEHEYIFVYCKNIRCKSDAVSKVISPGIPETSSVYKSFVKNSVVKNGKGNPPSDIILPKGFPSDEESFQIDSEDYSDVFFEETIKKKFIDQNDKRRFGIKHFPINKEVIIVKNSKLIKPVTMFTGWQNRNKLEKFILNNFQPIENDGNLNFYLTKSGNIEYKKERGKETRLISSIIKSVGNTTSARSRLEKMGIDFDYPKPVDLIKFLIEMGSKDGDIVLDSFAGSGTTGHAVMELNKESDNYRHFILIEMVEDTARNIIPKGLTKVMETKHTAKLTPPPPKTMDLRITN